MNNLELKKKALLLNTEDPLNVGLVAHYRLNNNGKDEVSGNDLTLENTANFNGLNTITGGACYYNNNTTTGGAMSKNTISLTQNQSWSFWINTNNYSTFQAIIGNHISRDSNFWFRLTTEGRILMYYNNGIDTSQIYSTFSYIMPINTWTHICVTTDSTKAYLYANGKYVSNITFSVVPKFAPQRIVVGRYVSPGAWFNGSLDNIRIYKRTLSNAEIKELYLRELTANTHNNLISYAKINNTLTDEVSDSRVFTKVGSYNNINGISYDETNCYENVDPGKSGQYLISDDSILLENQTMSCWYNPSISPLTMPDGIMGLISNHDYTSNIRNNFSIVITSTTIIIATNKSAGTAAVSINQPYSSLLNSWQHVLFNYNKITRLLNIYVNGKLLNTQVLSENPLLTSKKLIIGKWSDNYNAYSTVGKLDNCRIYNIDVDDYTARKIFLSEVYSNTLTNGLVAYYKLNGNGNDEISGNNLVLQGNATFNGNSYDNTKCYENNNTLINQSAASTNDVLLSGDISMCCWFYANIDITSMQGSFFGVTVISNHNYNSVTGDRYNYSLVIKSNQITVLTNNGDPKFAIYPILYTFNTLKQKWYHVAYTFNITTKMHKLYLNGINVASYSSTYIPATSNAKLLIGKWSNGYGNYTWTGKIDNARFYNRELTDLEVASIFKLEGGIEHDLL